MENQTSFDLNRAIQNWRDNLAQSPAFQRENLNELESHLRDSVTTLQMRGLSAEEAFMVAAKRIGKGGVLEKEFGKVNGNAVWLDRVLWMLLGLQVWCLIASISTFTSNVLPPLGEGLKKLLGFGSQSMPEGWLREVAAIIFSPLPTAVLVVIVMWRLLGRRKGAAAFIQKSLNRPWALACGLLVVCVVLRLVAICGFQFWYARMMSPDRNIDLWQVDSRTLILFHEYMILAGFTLLVAQRRVRSGAA